MDQKRITGKQEETSWIPEFSRTLAMAPGGPTVVPLSIEPPDLVQASVEYHNPTRGLLRRVQWAPEWIGIFPSNTTDLNSW